MQWTGYGYGAKTAGSATWRSVYEQVQHAHALKIMSDQDVRCLHELVRGRGWMDNVTAAQRDSYGAKYDAFKQRFASSGYRSSSQLADNSLAHKIQKDVNRTYGLFCRNSQLASFLFGLKRGTYLKSLHVVLLACSELFGYTQGMNFVAANFLLHYSERDSFILFCFLMNERHTRGLFMAQSSCLVDFIRVFEKRLKAHYRAVHDHLRVRVVSYCYFILFFYLAKSCPPV